MIQISAFVHDRVILLTIAISHESVFSKYAYVAFCFAFVVLYSASTAITKMIWSTAHMHFSQGYQKISSLFVNTKINEVWNATACRIHENVKLFHSGLWRQVCSLFI